MTAAGYIWQAWCEADGCAWRGRSFRGAHGGRASAEREANEHHLAVTQAPSFIGVHLAVSDIKAAAAFYRTLGLAVPDDDALGEHVEIDLGSGAHLALSIERIVRMYDPGWRAPALPPGSALQFQVESSEAVDALVDRLAAAGYNVHLPPKDAFFGARYAEVDDPDGNIVGVHGPRTRRI